MIFFFFCAQNKIKYIFTITHVRAEFFIKKVVYPSSFKTENLVKKNYGPTFVKKIELQRITHKPKD